MEKPDGQKVQPKSRVFEQLGAERFDALVVGGGITGAGIARDLALRGVRVALVEQQDFAFGTSSRSTKLIHGGLRYLEQMAFGLVFESCRERRILQQIAPHLVRPQPLLIPLYEDARRSPALVRTGLLLYDLLALFRNTHRHRMLDAAETLQRQPVLATEGLRGAALYWDCRMDDARLCLENVIAAREAGAVTVNYARVTRLSGTGDRLRGALVEDVETGREIDVGARVVVNATGPWLDRTCALGGETSHKLQTSRGSHILVPRLTASGEALYLSAGRDDRLFFVIPWGDLSLIGTTDIEDERPAEEVAASPAEVDYLIDETNRRLRGVHLGRDDVVASFAGLRPLLVHDRNSFGASREHAIFEAANGLLSMGGGKYTTYRSMAAEMTDRVMARLGRPRGRCLTRQVPLPGGATGDFDRYRKHQLRVAGGDTQLSESTLRRFLERYGSRTPHLLSLLDAQPDLIEPVAGDPRLLQLEVVYAARYELARSAEDVLRRRTGLSLLAADTPALRTAVNGILEAEA